MVLSVNIFTFVVQKILKIDTYKIYFRNKGHHWRSGWRRLNTAGYRKIHLGIWCLGGRAKWSEEDSYWARCTYIGQHGE